MANEGRMVEFGLDGQTARGYMIAPAQGEKHPGSNCDSGVVGVE